MTYDVEGPEPVARRSFIKPIRTAIVLGLLAVAVLIAFQWGWTQLTEPFDEAAATADVDATPPCTPAPDVIRSLPKPGNITVNVYNSSGITGLARDTAAELRRAGFKIGAVDNDPLDQRLGGVGEIRSAENVPKRVDQLLRYLPGATAVTDNRPGKRLDFAIGSGFDGVVTPEPLPKGEKENTEDDIPTC